MYAVSFEGPLQNLEYFLLIEHVIKAAIGRLSNILPLFCLYICLRLALLRSCLL